MFEKIRSLIFKFDPETAHDLAIKALKTNLVPVKVKNYESLKVKFLEKEIPNPISIAAGFDKNAEVYNSLFKLGFGFVEVGTITPEPQYGNSKPRVFRLEEDEALMTNAKKLLDDCKYRTQVNQKAVEQGQLRLTHLRNLMMEVRAKESLTYDKKGKPKGGTLGSGVSA